MAHKIEQQEDQGLGMFFIESKKGIIAEMTYKKKDNHILVIDHTEIDIAFREKGIGTELVKYAVDYARQHEYKIDPVCPFVADKIAETPAYQDVRI